MHCTVHEKHGMIAWACEVLAEVGISCFQTPEDP